MTETWIIGCTHFEIGDLVDDFGEAGGPADKALIRFCADAKVAHAKVGVLGDGFELLQILRRMKPRKALDFIWHAHGEALDALLEVLAWWIGGNHDDALVGMKIGGFEVLPHLKDGRWWFEHGQNHDWFISRCPRLAAGITFAAGQLERVVDADIDLWPSRLAARLAGVGRHGGNRAYLDPVAICALRHDCDHAVFAHTHEWMGRTMHMGVELQNCGPRVNGARSFAIARGEEQPCPTG